MPPAAKKAAKKSAKVAKQAVKKPAKKAVKKTAKKAAKRVAKSAKKSAAPTRAPTMGAPRADKGVGQAAVDARVAKLLPWQKKIVSTVDGIVTKSVPDAQKAIKWGQVMYGTKKSGWFLAVASHSKYCKLHFFGGILLTPPLPSGDGKQMRSLDIWADAPIDERQVALWVKQASNLPGWGSV